MAELAPAPPKPPALDADAFLRGIRWHQRWELFDGVITPGRNPVTEILARAGVPERLDEKTVLDIGPWNGCFTFECARRGARHILALGPEDPDATGFNKLRALLDVEEIVEYQRGSVYAMDPERTGTFDIVLFFGVLYHLRYPILALDRIHDVCKEALYVETFVIDDHFVMRDEAGHPCVTTLAATDPRLSHTPLWQFFPGEELQGDRSNWFGPNVRAVEDALSSSGFRVVHAHPWQDRLAVSALKVERSEFVGRCVLPQPSPTSPASGTHPGCR